MHGLTDFPQGSYAAIELARACVATYWPSLFAVPLAAGLEAEGSRSSRLAGPGFSVGLPLAVWALLSSLDLQAVLYAPPHVLWHRAFLSCFGLAAVVALLVALGLARPGRWRRGPSWPASFAYLAMVLAPGLDWFFLIFASSPKDLVLRVGP